MVAVAVDARAGGGVGSGAGEHSALRVEVAQCVDAVVGALGRLRAIMADPSQVPFRDVWASLERLEVAMGDKAVVDAGFAFIAHRDDAGREVGSTRAEDYLTARLRISESVAFERLRQGRELFAELAQPVPVPEEVLDNKAFVQAGPDASADEVARTREKLAAAESERMTRAQAECDAEQQRRAMILGNPSGGKVSADGADGGVVIAAEVLAMIERELEHVSRHAQPGKLQLRRQATVKAQEMGPGLLKTWLREQIRKANRHSVDAFGRRDLGAARAKRRLSISRPDHDGGVFINGYVDAATAALLKTAFAPARNPRKTTTSGQPDERSYSQRMADQLEAVLKGYISHGSKPVGGVGSIVITTTLNELAGLDGGSLLSTSTGIELSPLDIFRLGAAQHDFICVVDDKGLPLELGRGQRTASVWQKLALAATELVCTHPDCARAWAECDVHHIQAWIDDGPTDIENLTLLCRRHHVDNDDSRTGRNNMGHAKRCPDTHRVGYKPAGSSRILLNNSVPARKAAARRLIDPDPEPG